MSRITGAAWGYEDGDIETNPSTTPHLNELVAQRYSRRQALFGGISAVSAATLAPMMLAGCDDDQSPSGTCR